ncbi:hypothetical protein [Pseudomonas palleroniana]
MSINNISSNGRLTNEQAVAQAKELLEVKNAENIELTRNGILIEKTTKLMQQIGAARP